MGSSQQAQYGEAVYEMREAEGLQWSRIYDKFPEVPPASLRRIYHTERRERGELQDKREAPSPRIEGITPEEEIDEDAIWQTALRVSERRQRREWLKQQQTIEFDHGPVALVFMADLHLGSDGVDYARLDSDIDAILNTPGMYVVLAGDHLDNFIIGRLQRIMNGAEFNITEQWVMVKMVMRRLAPRLVASVAGNHGLWTYALTNVDYLQEIHKTLNPNILYQKYDMPVTVSVGGCERVIRVRHKWKGHSQYNPTHAIEKASMFDKGRAFDIGVAAHTHVSGLVREFNNGGQTGLAIQCGSYKRFDGYAEEVGFPQANEAIAVTAILDEGRMWGTNDLVVATEYMRAVYSTT